MTVNAVRLNHAVLFVTDLERSVAFYGRAFGMTVLAR
jgi:catechol 2,3-dioxygenase-like lactoylglutathione lyase family enzyme